MPVERSFSENDLTIVLAKLKLIQADPRLSLCRLALNAWVYSGSFALAIALYSSGAIYGILDAA